MTYNFRDIEAKWQSFWKDNETYKVTEDESKPKYYVLDMFPYPSGAGLHVGHPLGYIASDVVSRYMRLKGHNVLHPMGYDAFGLPAEQYAIQTGQHPAITTDANTAMYRQQLDRIGFSFDWSRQVRTCDPEYYRWTQWIFKQLFDCWYNNESNKAERVSSLVALFEANGSTGINACNEEHEPFTAEEWKAMDEAAQQSMLLNYRLAFLSESWVNWCPALGTVLANDEVKDGVSERGGHPVEQKLMTQWSLRITAYAQRLLDGLEKLDWADPIKEMQRNWIGRSEGASVRFQLDGYDEQIEVFTTRPDTIFGVTFMVLAPEHPLVNQITTDEYRTDVEAYIKYAASRSERDRMSEVKKITGQKTGAHVLHPFTGDQVEVWIGDYVLASYGTGAVMAVPCGDQRDWDFATHFGIEIKPLLEGVDISEAADPAKDKVFMNSDFLNGMTGHEAIPAAIKAIEEGGFGKGKINYRLRDAIFSRQRYWGEPFPVAFNGDTPYMLEDDHLPHPLPEVDKYLPTEDGEPPLARAKDWTNHNGDRFEYNTMPGWAGSSWYFLRYMDSNNENEFVARDKADYWGQVDLYIGGAEHATGHLLYSRFWTKFLYDLDLIGFDEPFQKMINQGMILGRSNFVYRVKNTNQFVSFGLRKEYQTSRMNVDINIVQNDELDVEAFRNWRPEFKDAEFILEDGVYRCGHEVEKMSKSKYNVQNPDVLCEEYGADTLRMYEMFLGPLEQFKPWDTNGITGVHNFLRKFWRLFNDDDKGLIISDEEPTKDELKVVHTCIKKVRDDIERYQFNTVVSNFMICVNELSNMKCHKRAALEPLVALISPYAPHIAEELWAQLGHETSVTVAALPEVDESVLVEDSFSYPVSFNGKMRFKMDLPLDLNPKQVEERVLSAEESQRWLDGKTPKKVIVVPKRIVNVVI